MKKYLVEAKCVPFFNPTAAFMTFTPRYFNWYIVAWFWALYCCLWPDTTNASIYRNPNVLN